MARSDTVTLLPLDRVAAIIQIDPLHFNGVVSARRPLRNACDDVWLQHDYQFVGRCSRESLAFALHQCEDMVAAHTGYPLLPTWIAEEDQSVETLGIVELYGSGSTNARGHAKSITANKGYIRALGRRAVSSISVGAAVVYSDLDGDGYKETATASSPTTLTDPEEISVFYPGESGDDRWEIRPATITIVAGTATAVFKREQAVLPELLEKMTDLTDAPPTIDGDDDTNFLTTVDLYRVYNDPSQQVVFYSEGSCASCGGTGCDSCGFDVETGCLGIRDPRLGVLSYKRADWDVATQAYVAAAFTQGREPDRMLIWYKAGWKDTRLKYPNRQMDPTWERLLVYYALSKLDTDAPGCDNTRRIIRHYQEDLAKSQSTGAGVGSSTQISQSDLDNPLGTRRGAVDMWRYMNSANVQLLNAR
jgi:hypothetical protein